MLLLFSLLLQLPLLVLLVMLLLSLLKGPFSSRRQ